MQCSCIFDADVQDSEYEEVRSRILSSKLNVRTCGECRREIPVGEKHKHECVRNEDEELLIFRTCLDCLSIRDNLCCNWFSGRVLDDVEESIEEANGEVSEDCIVPLTSKAKEFVFSVIESIWEETD